MFRKAFVFNALNLIGNMFYLFAVVCQDDFIPLDFYHDKNNLEIKRALVAW